MELTLLWVLAIALIVGGAIGSFLPVIPGIPLVFAGMLLAAWIDHFTRIGWVTLAVLGALTLLAVGVDFAATVLGAKRAGASRLALLGAGLGTLIGLFFSIPGIILGPFIGAAAGELLSRRSLEAAARVGVATWIALLFATIARAAILCVMLGLFLVRYLLSSTGATWF